MSNNKVQPRIMPGFMELLPEDQIAFNRMFDTIRRVYERYGFLPLDTATRVLWNFCNFLMLIEELLVGLQ